MYFYTYVLFNSFPETNYFSTSYIGDKVIFSTSMFKFESTIGLGFLLCGAYKALTIPKYLSDHTITSTVILQLRRELRALTKCGDFEVSNPKIIKHVNDSIQMPNTVTKLVSFLDKITVWNLYLSTLYILLSAHCTALGFSFLLDMY